MNACANASAAIDLVQSAAGLDALAPEWSALWRRAPSATPFQAPAWLIPWWRHFHPGRLAVVTLRLAHRLVGVVPLYRDDRGGRTRLRFLGAGNSDYLDAIVEPSAEAAVGSGLRHALNGLREGGAEVRLERLRAASPLLAHGPLGETEAAVEWEEPCPVLPLPHAPYAVWKQVRYARGRLGRMAGFGITTADDATLPDALARLATLHATRWRERGGRGVLADPDNAAFLEEAARGLLELGLLRLYLLHLEGRAVAAHFGMLAKGRAYYYVGGFDPALARLSVGTVLVGHAIEEAEREGAGEFDFLRGAEPYKYRWGAEDRWTSRRVLPPESTPGSRRT